MFYSTYEKNVFSYNELLAHAANSLIYFNDNCLFCWTAPIFKWEQLKKL